MITPDDAIVRDGDADDLRLSDANHAVIISIGEEIFRTGAQQPLYRLGTLRAAALVMVDAAMAGPEPWVDLHDMVEDMRGDALAILEATLADTMSTRHQDARKVGITVNEGTILLVAEILRAAGVPEHDYFSASQHVETALSNLRAAQGRAKTEVIQ